jgi:DNA segregation ATPase FtsK/SpoIIIE-like protein
LYEGKATANPDSNHECASAWTYAAKPARFVCIVQNRAEERKNTVRLAIVGKTRSGKSTALHRILSHALRQQWAGVLLLDGKGCELHHYANLPGVTYYGMDQIDGWATVLETHVTGMATRYRDLVGRGLREATETDPRWLIVADEVQQGTRDDDHGKTIRKALMTISEQGAALGDMLVVATQREVNAVPPSARHNMNVWLRVPARFVRKYTLRNRLIPWSV